MSSDDLRIMFIVSRYETVFGSKLPILNLKEPNFSVNLIYALKDWGFTYITGHDVPLTTIENAYRQSTKFFQLPLRVKRLIKADRNLALKTARGYTMVHGEQLDVSPRGKPDIKEVLDIGYVDKTSGRNISHYLGNNKWPKITRQNSRTRGRRNADGEMVNVITEYTSHASKLAKHLIKLTFEELGCPNELDKTLGMDALQVQRLTRYPPSNIAIQKEPGQMGAGSHSDYGGITILSAKGSGLFVLKQNITSENVVKGTFSDDLEVFSDNE